MECDAWIVGWSDFCASSTSVGVHLEYRSFWSSSVSIIILEKSKIKDKLENRKQQIKSSFQQTTKTWRIQHTTLYVLRLPRNIVLTIHPLNEIAKPRTSLQRILFLNTVLNSPSWWSSFQSPETRSYSLSFSTAPVHDCCPFTVGVQSYLSSCFLILLRICTPSWEGSMEEWEYSHVYLSTKYYLINCSLKQSYTYISILWL